MVQGLNILYVLGNATMRPRNATSYFLLKVRVHHDGESAHLRAKEAWVICAHNQPTSRTCKNGKGTGAEFGAEQGGVDLPRPLGFVREVP